MHVILPIVRTWKKYIKKRWRRNSRDTHKLVWGVTPSVRSFFFSNICTQPSIVVNMRGLAFCARLPVRDFKESRRTSWIIKKEAQENNFHKFGVYDSWHTSLYYILKDLFAWGCTTCKDFIAYLSYTNVWTECLSLSTNGQETFDDDLFFLCFIKVWGMSPRIVCFTSREEKPKRFDLEGREVFQDYREHYCFLFLIRSVISIAGRARTPCNSCIEQP